MPTATATKPRVQKVKKPEGEPYLFSELSEQAKQKAIQNACYYTVEDDWWQCTYEDAATCGIKITGFDIVYRREIYGKLLWSAESVAEQIIKEHGEGCDTYREAHCFLTALLPIKVKQRLLEDVDDIYMECADEIEDMEEEFKKDILQCYWKNLYEEYDYLTSNEAIIETIEANDYQFEEDGSRYGSEPDRNEYYGWEE